MDPNQAMRSDLYEPPSTSMLGRMWQFIIRTATAAAEEVASRPRGQQLLRQVDRLLEQVERVARFVARVAAGPWPAPTRGPARERDWGEGPLPLTSTPLLILILPTIILGILILMLPVLPLVIPFVIFGPCANAWYHGHLAVLGEWLPTPANIAKYLWRWRRTLRGIRFSGLRLMRIKNKPRNHQRASDENAANQDSILAKLLVWWPITLLALTGQVLRLGGPCPPVLFSPVPARRPLDASPRKRKMPDSEVVQVSVPAYQPFSLDPGEPGPSGLCSAVQPSNDGGKDRADSNNSDSDTSGCDSDSDSGTLEDAHAAGERKCPSPLQLLLSGSSLSSDDEEKDPTYVPNPIDENDDDEDSEKNEDEDEEEEDDDETGGDGTRNEEQETKGHNIEDFDKTLTPGTRTANQSQGL